jgi:hypothetical protein
MKRKTNTVYSIILILTALLVTLCLDNENIFSQSNGSFLLYHNPNYGISMKYPSSWNVYNYEAGAFQPSNNVGETCHTIYVYNPGQIPYFHKAIQVWTK